MACNEQTPPCPCTPYESTGCLDTYNTDCIKYTGEAIPCLEINTGDTLTDIIGHLEDVVCALSPTSWSTYDYGCLSSLNVEDQQSFAEGISGVICEMLGAQTPGSITSLSTMATNITNLSIQVNNLVNVTTLDCFETISSLPGPTATVATLLGAIQQVLCDHDTDIQSIASLGAVVLTANDSATIDFTASGTGNHTLTGSVKLSSALANNALTAQADGIHVLSPVITVSDTPSIDLTVSGVHNHTLQAAVKISAVAGNTIIEQVDGIYAPSASFSETPVTVNDSSSIDFTASGTSNHTITGSVKLDPNPSNIISITASGLLALPALASQTPITAVDTNTINLTTSGTDSHTVQADVKVSAASNNSITINGDGLHVNSTGFIQNQSALAQSATFRISGSPIIEGALPVVGVVANTSTKFDMIASTGRWRVGTDNSGNGTSNNQFTIYSQDDATDRITVQRGTGNVGLSTDGPNSTLTIAGTIGFSTGPLTAGVTNLTVTGGTSCYFVDATGGAVTINLPALASVGGRIYTFKRIDASGNSVTIDANGAETIDGSTTVSLAAQYDYVSIQVHNGAWYIINES